MLKISAKIIQTVEDVLCWMQRWHGFPLPTSRNTSREQLNWGGGQWSLDLRPVDPLGGDRKSPLLTEDGAPPTANARSSFSREDSGLSNGGRISDQPRPPSAWGENGENGDTGWVITSGSSEPRLHPTPLTGSPPSPPPAAGPHFPPLTGWATPPLSTPPQRTGLPHPRPAPTLPRAGVS